MIHLNIQINIVFINRKQKVSSSFSAEAELGSPKASSGTALVLSKREKIANLPVKYWCNAWKQADLYKNGSFHFGRASMLDSQEDIADFKSFRPR